MNSETKLTDEQLNIICARHNIKLESHERLTAGFSHELHRINQDLVLKLYSPHNPRSYKTELALLASDLPFKKPSLVAFREKDAEIDRDYVIMNYVAGTSLGKIWHRATETQREKLIAEICQVLRTINRLNPTVLPAPQASTWQEYITNVFESTLLKLQRKNIIGANLTQKAQRFFATNIGVLNQSQLYPVFWDVQFDNFIVNSNFQLQAVIDLESLELTSLDYPLVVIQKQMEVPEKFLDLEDEKYADKKDYQNLEDYYRKYYPEMFDFSNLEIRLEIYQLNHVLSLLVDWPDDRELYQKLDEIIS